MSAPLIFPPLQNPTGELPPTRTQTNPSPLRLRSFLRNSLPPWPRDFKNLVIQTFNCEGLSDASKEELLHGMTTSHIDVVILQETWGEIPKETRETPDGSLLLLHGTPCSTNQGRNSCRVGFLLSPSARQAYIFRHHHSSVFLKLMHA